MHFDIFPVQKLASHVKKQTNKQKNISMRFVYLSSAIFTLTQLRMHRQLTAIIVHITRTFTKTATTWETHEETMRMDVLHLQLRYCNFTNFWCSLFSVFLVVNGFTEIKKKRHLNEKNTLSDCGSIHGHRNLNKTERSVIAQYWNFNAPKICKITVGGGECTWRHLLVVQINCLARLFRPISAWHSTGWRGEVAWAQERNTFW